MVLLRGKALATAQWCASLIAMYSSAYTTSLEQHLAEYLLYRQGDTHATSQAFVCLACLDTHFCWLARKYKSIMVCHDFERQITEYRQA